MPASPEQFAQLVAHPSESFAVELKGWFDPSKPDGQAKIVKACMALRNNNGGFLVIGIDDKILQPQTTGGPPDVRKAFHPDTIQALITKYASTAFETFVHYEKAGDTTVVVIQVEAGVRYPVAAKADLMDGGKKPKPLVAKNRVYVRTLSSSGVVATSEATHQDWPTIAETCFNNREADVGAFLRRHLVGLTPATISALGSALAGAVTPSPPIADSAQELITDGIQRFMTQIRKRAITLPQHGSWEVAVRIVPELPQPLQLKAFGNTVLSSNPQYTGWPVWMDTRGFVDPESRPYVLDGAWETLVFDVPGHMSGHIEFWRMHPKGEFYLRRDLAEDQAVGRDAPPPLTILDFALPVLRVAEALAVALSFAQALAVTNTHTLAVACRWTSLKDRKLVSWASRDRMMSPGKRAEQNSVASTVAIPVNFSVNSLAEPVEALVRPLFEIFDGFALDKSIYEDLITRLINRRL